MFTAAAPGLLPDESTSELGGVALPPGSIVRSDPGFDQTGESRPVAWISRDILSEDALSKLVRSLVEVFPTTGLWPLAAAGLGGDSLERPWTDGELAGPPVEAVAPTPDDVLSGRGVTTFADAVTGPDYTASDVYTPHGGLLLVPARRPSDVPGALGWMGPVNHDLSGADISAVLASWEDRFGAVLVQIGFAELALLVRRPPAAENQVERLVDEHYAFCPDNIDQGLDRETYTDMLTVRDVWSFWWD
ncbi:DUF4253 domain-containing protein [Williamsia sp. CHRR-6]|uniref:DUF4253 domain-containing protein n=1 Tax=Williamsia sp. CHRR-6 TaxID=2835871 RepID=UPI001BD96334|nr:DUF4253 domain-containing protein [Williamsia sp. CHRR-6]MBT0565801.1 DUF4253 domain-containing protein [Williamsia sp. CHRR-6]